MAAATSAFQYDDALSSRDPRSSFPSDDPAHRYPSPPMSPPQDLPSDLTPWSTSHDPTTSSSNAQQHHAAGGGPQATHVPSVPATKVRPASYQPSPSTAPSTSYSLYTPDGSQLGYFPANGSSVVAGDDVYPSSRQPFQTDVFPPAAAPVGTNPAPSSTSSSNPSRKRASHQPPTASERSTTGRQRTIGEDHPAVVAFKLQHPRRAQLEFGSYILLQTLGEGEFGKVKLGVHKDYGEECAVKLIKKNNLGGEGDSKMMKVRREIEVLSHVKHPNVVRLYDLVETEKYIGIILGFADGGELFDHILAHRYLKERDASKLFAQLISGVHYLHSKNIIHRDLKLENLLLDKARNVIITDFGFANQFEGGRGDDLMATSCGSPCYAAPELVVAEGLYAGSAVDIWSCGVILYAMLSGYLPFDDDPANPEGDNINLLYRYILNTQLQFPPQISPTARDLLGIMLVPDPTQRATLGEIMAHPWLAAHRDVLGRSVDELEEVANRQHRIKRQQARREMEERKALKERAAAASAASSRVPTDMSRSRSERNTLMGPGTATSTTSAGGRPTQAVDGPESARIKPSRHQSAMPATSSTMPDFGPSALLEEEGPSVEGRSRLTVDQAGALEQTSSSDGGQESDFYLAEGAARGEPRSRVGSLAASGGGASSTDRAKVDVTGSPSTNARRKHHTIQVEYAEAVAPTFREDDLDPSTTSSPATGWTDSARSRTTSVQSRTTSTISSSSPIPVSHPVLSAPEVTALHHTVAAPSATSLPFENAQRRSVHDVDVDMRSASPLPSLGNPLEAATARPSTPDNSKAAVNVDHLSTPKASLGQPTSPPDTPRGPALSSITNPAQLSALADEAVRSDARTAGPVEPTQSRSTTKSRRVSVGLSSLLSSSSTARGSSHPPPATAENVPVSVSGDKAKADKKSRRNTLTLAFKSTLDRRSSKKSTPTSSVFTEPTTSRFAKTSTRPGSRMSAAPSASGPQTPTLPDALARAQEFSRPVPSSASRSRDASTASTGPAKKVMDWFRKKSLKSSGAPLEPAGIRDSYVNVETPSWTPPKGHRLSANLDHAVAPAAVAPPVVASSPAAPSLIVSGATDNDGPSSTFTSHSTAPSSFKAVDSLSSQRSAASARQAAADALAMPPPQSSSSAAKTTFNPANLRFHAGIIDKKTVTSDLPPVVLDHVVRVLQALDVDIKRDGEFRLKCTRSKRTKGAAVGLGIANSSVVPSGSTMSGFSFMGIASSSQTDKRGLPVPASPSFSSGLKGLMMRRSSSYASSAHLSPTVPQSPAQSSAADDSSSSIGGHTDDASSPAKSSGVQQASQDSGDEVRFSVEVTKIKNLPGLYSVDFKRIKGSAWNYKSIYQKAVDNLALADAAQ